MREGVIYKCYSFDIAGLMLGETRSKGTDESHGNNLREEVKAQTRW